MENLYVRGRFRTYEELLYNKYIGLNELSKKLRWIVSRMKWRNVRVFSGTETKEVMCSQLHCTGCELQTAIDYCSRIEQRCGGFDCELKTDGNYGNLRCKACHKNSF